MSEADKNPVVVLLESIVAKTYLAKWIRTDAQAILDNHAAAEVQRAEQAAAAEAEKEAIRAALGGWCPFARIRGEDAAYNRRLVSDGNGNAALKWGGAECVKGKCQIWDDATNDCGMKAKLLASTN